MPEPRLALFDPASLSNNGQLVGQAAGRGTAWFFNEQGRQWVLRHFHRGGWIGKCVTDLYLGVRAANSRAFREWHLLADLRALGLPVPRPVAAAFQGYGCFYSCDLITECLSQAEPLADRLCREKLGADLWQEVGATLQRFHSNGVYHADLNARNILIDGKGSVFLIDFDRGAIREGDAWKKSNLQRLRRSLLKIQKNATVFYFSIEDWQNLILGYEEQGSS